MSFETGSNFFFSGNKAEGQRRTGQDCCLIYNVVVTLQPCSKKTAPLAPLRLLKPVP